MLGFLQTIIYCVHILTLYVCIRTISHVISSVLALASICTFSILIFKYINTLHFCISYVAETAILASDFIVSVDAIPQTSGTSPYSPYISLLAKIYTFFVVAELLLLISNHFYRGSYRIYSWAWIQHTITDYCDEVFVQR